MDTTLYFISQALFILISLVSYTWVLKELLAALAKTSFTPERKKKIFRWTIGVLMAWVIFISLLSISGFIQDFSTLPPKFFSVLIIPLIGIISLMFTKTLKEILLFIPPQNIIRLQSFRIAVEVLLWLLFIQNLLPVQMTFEGRNFDILSGVSAPIIAHFCFMKKNWSRTAAIVWNLIGIGILINIVVIAILSMPTPFRFFMNEPANTILTYFPFIFLPGLLVPLAYGLHLVSLTQLLHKE